MNAAGTDRGLRARRARGPRAGRFERRLARRARRCAPRSRRRAGRWPQLEALPGRRLARRRGAAVPSGRCRPERRARRAASTPPRSGAGHPRRSPRAVRSRRRAADVAHRSAPPSLAAAIVAAILVDRRGRRGADRLRRRLVLARPGRGPSLVLHPLDAPKTSRRRPLDAERRDDAAARPRPPRLRPPATTTRSG